MKGPRIGVSCKIETLASIPCWQQAFCLQIAADRDSFGLEVCHGDVVALLTQIGLVVTRRVSSLAVAQVLGCTVVHSSRTQATVALSSGEAELYAIGQGVKLYFTRACQSFIDPKSN